jgi:Fe2+ transport system protein B
MTSGSKKINVTDLKAGVYSLIVNSANEQTTIKFIKE